MVLIWNSSLHRSLWKPFRVTQRKPHPFIPTLNMLLRSFILVSFLITIIHGMVCTIFRKGHAPYSILIESIWSAFARSEESCFPSWIWNKRHIYKVSCSPKLFKTNFQNCQITNYLYNLWRLEYHSDNPHHSNLLMHAMGIFCCIKPTAIASFKIILIIPIIITCKACNERPKQVKKIKIKIYITVITLTSLLRHYKQGKMEHKLRLQDLW